MTTMVDTIVSGLDTNWDAGILAKPSILDKFMNRDANWYASIKSIAIDSVLVEQHEDRTNEITGIDGAGTYYTQARWAILITVQTPGLEVAADGITKEDRLKALHDAVEDALSDMSGSGYLYRIFRTKDRTPKGGTTNKWMMDIYVEVTTPASSATLSGSGHALDSHSDVSAITETKGQIILYNTSWGALGIGSAGQVLTVTSGLPAWEDSVAGSDVFKTITGITNDVVADSPTDTLTLDSTDAKLTIVGTTATDTITFSVIEAQIDHDALTNFVAGEHVLEANLDHDALTNFVAGEHILEANLDHDALTNFVAAEHVDWAGAAAGTIHTDNYVEGGAGTDTDALHDNVAGEIMAITAKTTPAAADEFVLEDSAAANVKKAVTFANLEATLSHDALADFAANEHFTIASQKLDDLAETSLADPGADRVVFWDDSDTQFEFLTLGTGLTVTTNDLAFTTKTANTHYSVGQGIPYLDGSNNDVDMVWDYDATNFHTSVKVTVNNDDDDGEWVWEIYLPDDFSSFATNAMKYWHYTSDTTNAGITFSVTDGTDTFTDGRQQAASWTQTSVTAAELTSASVASSAGSKLVIRAKADGDTSDIVYIGGFDIFYNKA